MGRIAAEAIDGGLESAADVAERIVPYTARFDLPRGDELPLLEHLLSLAGPGESVTGIPAAAQ